MEGDAGSGQLTPTPPLTAQETAEPVAGRWMTGALAAVVIAALVLTVGGVLALLGHRNNAAAANGEAVAVTAAKDCIAATQAPDVKAMNDSQRKIVECATDNYAPQANLYSGLLADAYQTVQAQVKITQIRAAAEKHNPDGSIDVLVATRVSMSNVDEQGQELSYRLRVRMVPVDGTYKIDSIDPVSK
ncbi:MAG: Mce protein [Mycobacterium sp.]|nr:Mce protein [Mycobacterium sp.]